MAYNPNVTFDEAEAELSQQTELVLDVVAKGLQSYEKYQSVLADAHAARDLADPNTSLAAQFVDNGRVGTTAAEVADMMAALAAFKALDDVLRNVDVSQGDRMFALRKFR